MTKKDIMHWVNWFVALAVDLGVASLFIDGTFTGTFILSYLPLVVHQLVGWVIIITSLLKAFKIMK